MHALARRDDWIFFFGLRLLLRVLGFFLLFFFSLLSMGAWNWRATGWDLVGYTGREIACTNVSTAPRGCLVLMLYFCFI